MTIVTDKAPSPAVYTPWMSGKFSMAPGFRPLGTDFGNGPLDQAVFQRDSEWDRYHQNKLECEAERLSKYFQVDGLDAAKREVITAWMQERVPTDTGVSVELNDREDPLWTLSKAIQEDFAILDLSNDPDRIVALSTCSASRWGAEEKIGDSFLVAHQPVPDFDPVRRAAPGLLEACLNRGPWVRFVWTLEDDDRLNRHPEPPLGADPVAWQGRFFSENKFVIRTERQVLWGFPSVKAVLFTIRILHVSYDQLLQNPAWIGPLADALETMSLESQRYKGITEAHGRIVASLRDLVR